LQDYLPAWRAARGKELLNCILGGSADVPTQQRVRGEILMAMGIEDISLETLRHFWDVPRDGTPASARDYINAGPWNDDRPRPPVGGY
jgi:hypothetical protein